MFIQRASQELERDFRETFQRLVSAGTAFDAGQGYEAAGIAAVLRVAADLRAVPRATSRRPAGPEPAHSLATAGLLVHDLLATPLPIEKGRMAVPRAVALDESEVDRYALERFEAKG